MEITLGSDLEFLGAEREAMHYFITGHTGFKGSWLVSWLVQKGHQVSGLSLPAQKGSLYEQADISRLLKNNYLQDIRDREAVRLALIETQPDVVLHLAAQPLVLESYRDPEFTFTTNVDGTLNILMAVQEIESVQAQLFITTDKVYRNVAKLEGYVESDALGGHDPYSASKSMADILVESWSSSLETRPTGIARAGNVIGGGDICENRLVPDVLKAFSLGESPIIRNADHVRPWQHVLDCLHGYLELVDALLEGKVGSSAWNFGPPPENFVTVGELAQMLASAWGNSADLVYETDASVFEAPILTLNSEKARRNLGWRDLLTLDEAAEWTVEWSKRALSGESALEIVDDQIARYVERI